jgi:nucleoside-diphosphate-sugar epimerase
MGSVEELEDRLSEPTAKVIEDLRCVDGDILLLGVGGKIGPSLARMARRASDLAGVARRVIGVSRFSTPGAQEKLDRHGIETIRCDLLEEESLNALPEAPNVIFMAGKKFGSIGQETWTWALNTHLPALVCRRFRGSRLIGFSTGTVYGLTAVAGGGSVENDEPVPVGEYAMSCLGRERMIQHFSRVLGIPAVVIRLNYACELRYGVLVDIAHKVWRGEAINLEMGYFNIIWQGDANAIVLRTFRHAATPPFIINVTGPETLRVRDVAIEFGRRLNRKVSFCGVEAPTAILSNASRAHHLFGRPAVSPAQLIGWIADWIQAGGPTLDKPTHFEVRNGRF